MNTIRKWIRNIFGFSGREANGFIILLPLMVILVLAEPVYHLWISDRPGDFSSEAKILDSLITFWDGHENVLTKDKEPVLSGFNPNNATEEELQSLGFSKNLSTRIASYRQNGGKFRVKSDLLKIYGLDSTFYRKLYAYILLPEKIRPGIATPKPGFKKKEKAFRPERFDLNTADTTQLKSVYGIGSVLAKRIMKFREGLGGFIRQEQLNEVYGLDSAVAQQLRAVSFIATDFIPRKLDMNKATKKDLLAHPYIKKPLAEAIVTYRFQHGNFARVEDLRRLSFLKQTEIDKVLPYLTVNP